MCILKNEGNTDNHTYGRIIHFSSHRYHMSNLSLIDIAEQEPVFSMRPSINLLPSCGCVFAGGGGGGGGGGVGVGG